MATATYLHVKGERRSEHSGRGRQAFGLPIHLYCSAGALAEQLEMGVLNRSCAEGERLSRVTSPSLIISADNLEMLLD